MFQQTQKKMFKVLAPIEKKTASGANNGTYWARCGVAYENKDRSINCHLDFIPRDYKFQIRELDQEDIQRMNERREARTRTEGSKPYGSTTYASNSYASANLPMSSPEGRDARTDDTPF